MKRALRVCQRVIFACVFCAALSAQDVFNDNLSVEERAVLSSGETLIKNTSSYKKMCLEASNPQVQKLRQTVMEMKPAYFAEVIKEYPVQGREDLPSVFAQLVTDVSSYAGIPYFSERKQKYYDLYTWAKITSSSQEGNTLKMMADFEMKPFGEVSMRIETEVGKDYFWYESTNTTLMRYYDKFDCVKPENMKSLIVIFKSGDKWVLYGAGAVKAPSIFFLRDRVDTSFMNRIKAFCAYFFAKMEQQGEIPASH